MSYPWGDAAIADIKNWITSNRSWCIPLSKNGARDMIAEIERLRTESESHEFIGWYEGYHGRDAEVDVLKAKNERLRSAIEFAHSEGFQWPSDPMAEFASSQQQPEVK